MSLRDEILEAFPGLTPEGRDDGAIAAALSVGRTRIVKTEIGKGTIIDTIGLASANALLDVIDSAPDYRHVKQLLENGWFNIGSSLARYSLDALVPSVITQAESDALKALSVKDDHVTPQQVAQALEGM